MKNKKDRVLSLSEQRSQSTQRPKMERVFSIQETDTGPHQHLIDQRKESTTSLSRIVANRKPGCCQKHKLKFISLIAIVSAIVVALSGFGIYEIINSKKECLED